MGTSCAASLAGGEQHSVVSTPRAATRVAIVSSATDGGGLTSLRQLLTRLLHELGLHLRPILVRDGIVSRVGLDVAGYIFHSTPSRLEARGVGWRRTVRSFDAHTVFGPTEISFARYDLPLVLSVRYPFPLADSLDVRVPLIDGAVVDLALSIPAEVWLRPGNQLLRAASELFGERVKIPSNMPFGAWLRGRLHDDIQAGVCSDNLPFDHWVPPNFCRRIWVGYERGRVPWSRPWVLGMFRPWPDAAGLRW